MPTQVFSLFFDAFSSLTRHSHASNPTHHYVCKWEASAYITKCDKIILLWTDVTWKYKTFWVLKYLSCNLVTGCWCSLRHTRKIDQWGISATRASCLSMLGLQVPDRISCIAMRPFVDVAECAGFLKLWPRRAKTRRGVFPRKGRK